MFHLSEELSELVYLACGKFINHTYMVEINSEVQKADFNTVIYSSVCFGALVSKALLCSFFPRTKALAEINL